MRGAYIASYPNVSILNNTPYTVVGQVGYMSWTCSDDSFVVQPYTIWHAKSRGVCLVTQISGHGIVTKSDPTQTTKGKAPKPPPTDDIITTAIPYKSAGTLYAQFQVQLIPSSNGKKQFNIGRFTSLE